MLEDGDSFAGGWVLLRTGDSYGGSGCSPAGKTTIVMGDYLVDKDTGMVVGGCALANHALGSRKCMYWWMWVISHNATILQSKT